MILCHGLLNITTFNMLPSDDMTNGIFGEDSFSSGMLEPLNDRLDIMRYSTSNFIYNMGTGFYFMCGALIGTIITLLLMFIREFCGIFKLKKVTDRLSKVFSPGLYQRLFIQLNYELLINGFIQLMVISVIKTYCDYFTVILACIAILSCIIYPIFSG
jgi:hypothetical protein